MAANPLLKRMLDAGMQFTEMSQKQAEKLVKEFVKVGQARKKDSDEMVRQIVDRGRNLSEQIVATVQAELANQMSKFAVRLDDIEGRVEALAAKVGVAAKAATDKVADTKAGEPKTPKMAPAVPVAQAHVAEPTVAKPSVAEPSEPAVDEPTKADPQSD
ncbi:MAG: hypothetical protein K8R99_04650 [Actinomycetia bacterium]|nr:hypothetical protein [Actinomycetes bacterium]